MNTQIKSEGGYVDLLIGILITVFVIGFLYVRWWSTTSDIPQSEESIQPLTASGTVPTNQHERYQADIDAAEALQGSFEIDKNKLENALEI